MAGVQEQLDAALAAVAQAEAAQQLAVEEAQAAQAALAAAQENQAPAAGPVTYAGNPAMAVQGLIDYTSKQGTYLYEKATKALPSEMDCKPNKSYLFIEQLTDRSKASDWSELITVTTPAGEINILDRHGSATMEQLKEDAHNRYIGKSSRMEQCSIQMAECLMNSLTAAAQMTIRLKKDEYTVGGVAIGILMFKVIMKTTTLDSEITSRHIRTKIQDLHIFAKQVGGDVKQIKEYFNLLVVELASRGQVCEDARDHVLKAFKACEDRSFKEWVGRTQDAIDVGKEDLSAKQLLDLGLFKYERLVMEGEWQAPSPEEAQIVALRAEIEELQAMGATMNEDKNAHGKATNSQGKSSSMAGPDKPPWMVKPPAEGEPKSKIVNKKEYFWCPNHLAYGRHTPAECRGKGYKVPKEANKTDDKDKAKARTIAEALAAIIDDEEE
jgi:hypothetical protein